VTVIEHRWSPDIGPASTRPHQPEPGSSLTRDRLASGDGQRGCDVRFTPMNQRHRRGWLCRLSATTGLMHRSKEQAADHRSFWVDAFWLKGDREGYINFKARQSERRRLWPRGLRAENSCRIPLRATRFGERELPGILLVADLLVLRTCQRCEKRTRSSISGSVNASGCISSSSHGSVTPSPLL
jgi:hypothetical protein